MSVFELQLLIRYIVCGAFTFFLYQGLSGIVYYRHHKLASSFWYIGMCFASSAYTVLIFLLTFKYIEFANLIKLTWIFGVATYICYLYAIMSFLNLRHKRLELAKYVSILLMFIHLISLPTNLIYEPRLGGLESNILFQIFNSTSKLTILGKALGAIYLAVVMITSYDILVELFRYRRSEKTLIFGVLFTMAACLNDAVLGTVSWIVTIPIYYLGNVFEAIRFSGYFQAKLYSEIKTLEEENIVNKTRAEEGFISKKLLRLLSHDVANGLHVIHSSCRRAMKNIEDASKVKANLERIDRGALLIEEVTDVVKLIEKSRSGMLRVDLEKINVSSVLSDVGHIFSERLTRKNLSFDIETFYPGICVIAEEKSFKNQVLNNLISNAIKFSPEDSSIVIRVKREDGKVHISVTDQGMGIPDEIKDKLFEENSVTTRPGTSGEQGNGFGMPLMYNFVKVYGGDVTVESVTEGSATGTNITIILKEA